MITREVDYAIRTVLALAKRDANATAAATADLAKEADIPFRFLRRIVRKLVEGGILTSQRGNGGGVKLTRGADAISLLSVIHAVDSRSTKLNLCTISTANCPRSGRCRVHQELFALQTLLQSKLEQIAINQLLLEPLEEGCPQDVTGETAATSDP
ncbi:MAG: Rrf2 family transcriptional regulator [Phycisphaerae bacterium]|nr:Rrf2 family transcriptional regulator [Phycisphaerae bacterium]